MNQSQNFYLWHKLNTGLCWSSGMIIVVESSKVNSIYEPNSVYIVHQGWTGQFISKWRQPNCCVKVSLLFVITESINVETIIGKKQKKKVFLFENFSRYLKLNRGSNQTANNRSTRCSLLRRNMQWHVYIGHFRWFIQSERKLAAASCFHPSSWMITFDEWTVYAVHF
jgi:hypothetical protein